jgi:uncharacterized protein YecE (DUF72 family)
MKTAKLPVRSGIRKRGKPGVIRVGTASWSDPGFIADWYPKGMPPRKRLPWYAEHFNLVEVNSSFYAVPSPEATERWCDDTPEDFVFDVKLHRLLSRHSTKVALLPPELRRHAKLHGEKVELTPKLEALLVERILLAVQPIAEAGKLGALLLQLSPSFSPRRNDLTELDSLLDLLEGQTVVVELRHREWLTAPLQQKTMAFFKKRGVALVSVDAPRSEHFMVMPSTDVVTSPKLAYLRAHGRNERGYISGRTVAARFDYDYSDAEVEEIAGRAETLSTLAAETHVIFNNNKSSFAPKAAERLRRLIES